MKKNYTITLVLTTPKGREILKDFTYKHVHRSDAYCEITKEMITYKTLGYKAYIGNVSEWDEVWV